MLKKLHKNYSNATTQCIQVIYLQKYLKGLDEQTDYILVESDNCGYHIAQCRCGHETLFQHNFTYLPDPSTHHGKVCHECKYFVTEEHFYKNPYTCFYCKQPISEQ